MCTDWTVTWSLRHEAYATQGYNNVQLLASMKRATENTVSLLDLFKHTEIFASDWKILKSTANKFIRI